MKRFYTAEEEEQAYHSSCKVARQQKQAECSSYSALPPELAFPMSFTLSAANPTFNGGNEQYYLSATAAATEAS
ncbi:hypothetical protein GOP47_0014365 [Adiantum capillus-veneris]|uniref:Uncharacterized protein n=1 Tax=Adiantum capillus-veneris TaxID=13818 RepID=A0A9D4ULM7_ADICA|nr:hypothetical protein GOP47_0014365 [Adiantum capillus-veneris]